jgi:DNA-binding transcriptional LysR family regulator
VKAAELNGEPMIAFERGLSHRRTMDELLASAGVMPRIVSETNDPQIAKNLVNHGIGIALIPRWAVFEGDRLHVLELEGHSLVREVSIIYLKRHTSAVRVFVEFSRQFRQAAKK